MSRSIRTVVAVLAAATALVTVASANADGEAGLVIQDGDSVRTYCIAFEGDGIRGDALLRAAGQEFDAYGGGSGLAVCSIGDRGCQDAGSFSSCFCQCQGGDCTYWAFFTRGYGNKWVYSSLAFNLLQAKDGDVHGWKWGKGAPSSAPSPQDVSFDQICGHAPRGGATPTATSLPQTAAPTAAATNPPTATSSLTTLPGTALPSASAEPTASASAAASPPLVTLTASIESPSPDTTPGVPDAGSLGDDGGPGNTGTFVAFGAIVLALVAAIGGGLIWRRTHAG